MRLAKLSKLLELERSEHEQAMDAANCQLESLRAECFALHRSQAMSQYNEQSMRSLQHRNDQVCILFWLLLSCVIDAGGVVVVVYVIVSVVVVIIVTPMN